MHKAMFERIHCTPYQLDTRDTEILAELTAKWEAVPGPRVGDFVITSNGLQRFTHDWGNELQTTCATFGGAKSGSFYLGHGFMSFSGSLDPGVPKSGLKLTDEIRPGACWFFSHGFAEASNGVSVMVPCRVYKLE